MTRRNTTGAELPAARQRAVGGRAGAAPVTVLKPKIPIKKARSKHRVKAIPLDTGSPAEPPQPPAPLDGDAPTRLQPPAMAVLKVLETGTIDPRDLVIDETKNGRRFRHTPTAIQERAQDLLNRGQQQAVQVFRNDEGKKEVVFGYLRSLAALYLTENDLYIPQGNTEPAFYPLRYELVELTPEQRLVNNAIENLKRKDLDDIDLLHLFKRLMKELTLNQKQIAVELRISESLVSRVLSLEKLNAREQRLVSQGVIKSEQARELAAIPAEERRPLVDKLMAGEKVTVADIKQAATQAKKDGRPKPSTAQEEEEEDEGKALSAKQIGLPFEFVANHPADGETPDPVEKWCAEFVRYRLGKVDGRRLIRSLYTLAGLDAPSWVRGIQV